MEPPQAPAEPAEARHPTEPERAVKAIVGGVILGIVLRLFAARPA